MSMSHPGLYVPPSFTTGHPSGRNADEGSVKEIKDDVGRASEAVGRVLEGSWQKGPSQPGAQTQVYATGENADGRPATQMAPFEQALGLQALVNGVEGEAEETPLLLLLLLLLG